MPFWQTHLGFVVACQVLDPEGGGGRAPDGADCPYLDLVLREVRIDWMVVERLTSDRKVWKVKVAGRMEHLDFWERQKGHGYR